MGRYLPVTPLTKPMSTSLHKDPIFLRRLKEYRDKPNNNDRDFMLSLVRHALRGFRNLYPAVELLMQKPLSADFWEDVFEHSRDVAFFNTKVSPSLLQAMDHNFQQCFKVNTDGKNTFEKTMVWLLSQGVSVEPYHSILDKKLRPRTDPESTLWMIAFLTNYPATSSKTLRNKLLEWVSTSFCLEMDDLTHLTSRYLDNAQQNQGLFASNDLDLTDNFDYFFRSSKMMVPALNWTDDQIIDDTTRKNMWTGWIDRFLSHIVLDNTNPDHVEFGMRLFKAQLFFEDSSELREMSNTWLAQIPNFINDIYPLLECASSIGNIAYEQLSLVYIQSHGSGQIKSLDFDHV